MKRKISYYILFAFIILGNLHAQNIPKDSLNKVKDINSTNIYITNFGAYPNSFTNSADAICKALEAASKVEHPYLIFPYGRYDIWPEGAAHKEYFISNTSTQEECPSKIKTIGILIKKIKNLVIEGSGSTIMCHGKMITFVLDSCENVVIFNLSIDFERPTMSEARVVNITDKTVDLAVHKDSKYAILYNRINWYGEGWSSKLLHAIELDSATETLHYSRWNDIFNKSNVEEINHNHLRFQIPKDFHTKVGNVVTIRDVIRDQVGMFILNSKNVTLLDVNMNYMHGLGIVSQFSENITMKHVVCAPNPSSGRIMASSADFMHFSGCKGLIDIGNCTFNGAHDDPINIHGTHLRIVKQVADDKILVRFKHGQSYGFTAFYVGDEIDFIHANDLIVYGTNKVKTVNRINDYEIELTLVNPSPKGIKENDCIENITWTPSVHIHDCKFSRTNTRGILLTTRRNVVIENNTFFRLGMNAILIADDAMNWFESGLVRDVLIKGNEFIDCGYNGGPGNAVIAIAPENTIVDINNPVHRNIRIEDNIFKTYDYPILFAKSTKGLNFKGNKIIRTSLLNPISDNKFTLSFDACSDVKIEGNSYEGDVLGKNIHVDRMKTKDIKIINDKVFK